MTVREGPAGRRARARSLGEMPLFKSLPCKRIAGSPRRPAGAILLVCLAVGAVPGQPALAAEALPRRPVTLALPGPPSKILPADVDGDGLTDVAVVLVYTEYEEIAFDRVQGFLQMTEIVPALSERRELRVYLQRPGGELRLSGPPMELPAEVSALSAGPPAFPLVALTDAGASALLLESGESQGRLRLEPFFFEEPVLRGSRTFLPDLEIVRDLDGDSLGDLLFPSAEGPSVFRGTEEGFRTAASARLRLPGDEEGRDDVVWRRYPLPRQEDVDGDDLPDLVVGEGSSFEGSPYVLRGAGRGRFEDPVELDLASVSGQGDDAFGLLQLGDIDGGGAAELVMYREVSSEKDGMAEAKRPLHVYRIHRLRSDLTVEERPYAEFEAEGHPFEGDWAGRFAVPFRDLDGDGLKDLVTVNLDFSIFQILRVMTTKKFGIGLKFNIFAQQPDGSFKAVENLELEDKILVDLDDLKLGRLGNFAGDFDGDGRLEFLTLKGGRTLEIHRGLPGCAYSRRPEFRLKLPEAPPDPGLVKVMDLDGDGMDDLAVTRPLEPDPSGATAPVALDLYLSRADP